MTSLPTRRRCLLGAVGLVLAGPATAQGYPIWTAPVPAIPVYPIAGTDDLNGDGVRDLVQGPEALTNGPVHLRSGRDGSLIRSIAAPQAARRFGWSVAAFPDADGDGLDDLLVGDPSAGALPAAAGAVFVVSSANGAVLRTVFSPTGAQSFGTVVAASSDLDGDGTAEILATAWSPTQVCVISGATGTLLRTYAGTGPFDGYGQSLLDAGDVDGDGTADHAIGVTQPGQSLFPPNVPTGTGFVELRSGATGSLLWTSSGTAVGDAFGWSLARTADLDGDAHPDLLVGAPQRAPCSDKTCHTGPGYAVVLSAATGAVLRAMHGTVLAEEFGHAVAAMPDLDGDDIDDLVVGAPGNDSVWYTTFPGAAHLYSGASGARLAVLATAQAPFAGQAVVALGDADGDAVPDVATGPSLQAVSVVGVPAGGTRVGAGCAGTNGRTPRLATYGGEVAAAGNADFGLAVSRGLPGAQTALFLATATNQTGISFGGCRVHLAGVVVQASPAPALSSRGQRLLPLPVPALPPAAVGTPLTWQALVLDPASGNGAFTVTEAVVTTVR